ncbi:MAG: biotin--[acetyl-CoA-carboxylase] ligase [Proteobacteria bacterium]|nr:biotin--[acetyl-CoA-carboxylase] ligase [Pseudomonadota bacterium]
MHTEINLGQTKAFSKISLADLLAAIGTLESMGCAIYINQAGHYYLPKQYDLINLDAIIQQTGNLAIDYLFSTESTNKTVKKNRSLLADYQSNGKGRREKQWITPLGQSICLSKNFSFNGSPSDLCGYNIVVAVAIVNALKQLKLDSGISLKWPNDIYLHDAKIGGILIEISAMSPDRCQLTVGIGINWQINTETLEKLEQKASNLKPINSTINRTELIIEILNSLDLHNLLFEKQGLKLFQQIWHQHDYFAGKQIQVFGNKTIKTGKYLGINLQGALLLEHKQQIASITSGEVSVRPL